MNKIANLIFINLCFLHLVSCQIPESHAADDTVVQVISINNENMFSMKLSLEDSIKDELLSNNCTYAYCDLVLLDSMGNSQGSDFTDSSSNDFSTKINSLEVEAELINETNYTMTVFIYIETSSATEQTISFESDEFSASTVTDENDLILTLHEISEN